MLPHRSILPSIPGAHGRGLSSTSSANGRDYGKSHNSAIGNNFEHNRYTATFVMALWQSFRFANIQRGSDAILSSTSYGRIAKGEGAALFSTTANVKVCKAPYIIRWHFDNPRCCPISLVLRTQHSFSCRTERNPRSTRQTSSQSPTGARASPILRIFLSMSRALNEMFSSARFALVYRAFLESSPK